MDKIYDVIIIGAGPAGLTAAIYATRANLDTLIIEEAVPGGKLTKTNEIENYPGIKKMSGLDLAEQLKEHALSFGAKLIMASVLKVNSDKEITLKDGKTLKAKAIIIASGTKERILNVPQSLEYTGMGISYCAVCDGFFYRKKDVVVVGGGNSALEESLYLANIVNKLTIVIRRDEFRAEATIIDKVKNNPKIEIVYNHIPDSLILENGRIVGLKTKDTKDGSYLDIKCSGIFPYIGADPCTSFVEPNILDEKGYIIVNKDMSTDIKGIYGAGDVTNKDLRQVVTACNDGAIAANAIVKLLKE